jgi:hypothetical protein
MTSNQTCNQCQSALPDLLLDPASPANLTARAHLSVCNACNQEFQTLQATLNLLDIWHAPEPSAFFDQKLAVRLREEQATAPAGWLERLQSYLQFSTGRQFRPALAGALALVLLLGGGTVADLSGVFHKQPTQASATVEDLQILDRNDQAIQTMDQLLQEETSPDNAGGTPRS